MRVCLVSNEFAPFHGAGIGTYASLMAAAWAGTGHEVHVLTGDHPGLGEDGARLRPGVRFHTVDPTGGPEFAGIGTWSERYALGVLAALERLHAAHPFDYIEFPDYGGEGAYATWARRSSGSLAGAVLGVRLHTPRRECRALNQESWLDEEGARVDALEDGALRRADVLISPSASLLEIVRGRLGGGPGWPWEAVVPYPFDRAAVGELLPAAGGAAMEPDSPPTVLYYGRLERRKGVHLLVEAARRMLDGGVNARFRFIGGDTLTGPLGTSLRAHLEVLAGPHAGRAIEFHGPRPRRQLGEEIRRAAIVCVPSLWENFPNVVLESMALGAFVVGSDAGGIGEIIRDGEDGLLFPAGDGEALERVLCAALADPALRRTVSAAAPGRIAALCDPAAVVAQTIVAVEGAKQPGSSGREMPAGPTRVSCVVVVDESDRGLGETLGCVRAQGELVSDCTVVLRGGAGPEREALASRVEAVAKGAGFGVMMSEPCGPARARNAALRGVRAEWVLVLESGDVIPDGSVERLLGGAAQDRDVAWVGGLAAWRDGGWGPAAVALERDLLAVGSAPGPAIIRRIAIERVGGWDEPGAGDDAGADWSLACRLSAAGETWVIVPAVVMSRPAGRGVGPAPLAEVVQMLEGQPALPAEMTRVAKVLAARAAASEQRAGELDTARSALQARLESISMGWGGGEPPPGPRRAIHHEAIYRQRLMEENLKYRLADRMNGALKATGVQRPLKAIAQSARSFIRRLAGG